MRLLSRLLSPLLLLTLLCTCGPAPKPDAPLPRLGSADAPTRYDNFAELEPLFYQSTDTAYVINFWATWCKPCREEIPLLEKLAGEHQGDPLRIVLVSLDTEESAIRRIPAFLAQHAPSLNAVILTDEDPAWGKTIDRVWTGSLPTTILYRGQRRYVYRRNFPTYVDLKGAVAPLFLR
ncbi:TlpA disulfide reductase family protein [Neolewinella agarilytica]|uniref:Thiol-disulfide isomerase or thioredoxin n=1 Tax=Neolewinella agarilytica TaxID=478744 RepID=A0A1H9NF84_9BACT|nr:TlpA family protein disulfide reductase [Neolewinella agarilytica]SER34335.1 Thiol-disulfide isomerase or thioredoxin [Neolewinella agarilytica]